MPMNDLDGLRWISTSESGTERVEVNVGLEEDGDGELELNGGGWIASGG